MGLGVISIFYCCCWSYRKIDHGSSTLFAMQWNFSEVSTSRHFGFSPPCEWTLEPSLLQHSHEPLRFSEIVGSCRKSSVACRGPSDLRTQLSPNCLQTSYIFQPTHSRLLSPCKHSPTIKKLTLMVMEDPCQSLTAINQSWGCRTNMCSQGENIHQ